MCGLCRGAVVVVVTLISYNDRGCCCRDDYEEETIVIDYFLYTDVDYVGSLLQLIFHCSARLVVTIHDLLLTSIFR
jgi:hypothetical protein